MDGEVTSDLEAGGGAAFTAGPNLVDSAVARTARPLGTSFRRLPCPVVDGVPRLDRGHHQRRAFPHQPPQFPIHCASNHES